MGKAMEGDHFPDGASENEETTFCVLQKRDLEVMKPINQQRWYRDLFMGCVHVIFLVEIHGTF